MLKEILKSASGARAAIAAGLVFCVGGLAFFWYALRSPSSVHAFVNTGVISVRAPIAGRLVLASEMRVGRVVSPSDELGRIESRLENPRVSQLLVQQQEIAARIANLEQQRVGAKQRLEARLEMIERFKNENVKQKDLQEKYFRAQLDSARLCAGRIRIRQSHVAPRCGLCLSERRPARRLLAASVAVGELKARWRRSFGLRSFRAP